MELLSPFHLYITTKKSPTTLTQSIVEDFIIKKNFSRSSLASIEIALDKFPDNLF